MKRNRKTVRLLNNNQGFTLVELAVVVIIIGVLAAFAVPKFRDAVERSKASEAFNYLSTVRASQERYHARNATYAEDLTKLDVHLSNPKYFTVGTPTGGGQDNTFEEGWKLTLIRVGAAAGYGAYTVTFTEEGFDVADSTVADADHDAINPMAE